MEIFGSIFAGLGLFFIGVKSLSVNMKLLTGHRFRTLLQKLTQRPVLSSLIGVLSGSVTQSSSAMTYTAISMVSTGVLAPRKALPIIVWANVGAVMLVLLATFDIHIFIFYLLGITGIGFYFDLNESERFKPIISALFSTCTLFLGLWLIKSGLEPLKDADFIRDYLSANTVSLFALFLIGLFAAAATHSAMTVSAVTVAISTSGLLGLEQLLMVVFGANIGAAMSLYFMSRNIYGEGRTLIFIQVWIRCLSVVLVLPLLFIQLQPDSDLLKTLLHFLDENRENQLVWAALLLQLSAAIFASLFGNTLYNLASKLLPQNYADHLARPKYLYQQALSNTDSALDLVDKEQHDLITRLPKFLDELRPDEIVVPVVSSNTYYTASDNIAKECKKFLDELLKREQSVTSLERAVNAQLRNELFIYIQDGCNSFIETLKTPFNEQAAENVRRNLLEGLHTVLILLSEIKNDDDLDVILRMSGDRSQLMKKIRTNLFDSDHVLSQDSQTRLFASTTLFERLVWLINSYASMMKRLKTF
jgi:phosphate:Na+ symporter